MAKIVKQRKKTRDPIHKNRIKVLEKKNKKDGDHFLPKTRPKSGKNSGPKIRKIGEKC